MTCVSARRRIFIKYLIKCFEDVGWPRPARTALDPTSNN